MKGFRNRGMSRRALYVATGLAFIALSNAAGVMTLVYCARNELAISIPEAIGYIIFPSICALPFFWMSLADSKER